MKKKYRRAVCFAIGCIWLILLSPFLIIGIIGELIVKLFEWLCLRVFPADWLKTKLRVYGYGQDCPCQKKEKLMKKNPSIKQSNETITW